MKKITNIIGGSLIVTIFLLSCTKELDKVNQNNNNYPNDVLSKNQLPQAILGTAVMGVGTDLAWYASIYMEHSVGVTSQAFAADTRTSTNIPSLVDNSWNSIYTSNLVTARDIVKKSQITENDAYMEAVGCILVAFNLGLVVDIWGDAPFKEAFNINNLQPKYDSASDLYDIVISYLDRAIILLNKPNQIPLPNIEDYLYAGDKEKWQKAAYSLLARYYLRLGGIKDGYYQKSLKAVSSGFSNAEEAMVFTKFTATQGEWNPWYSFLRQRDYLATSNTLYSLMPEADSSRKKRMFTIPDGSKNVSNPLSIDLQGGAFYKGYCIAKQTQDASFGIPLMSYHELLFIKAECEQRLSLGTALKSLQDAIRANFLWNGNTLAEANSFINSTITSPDLSTILTQKYIAQYPFESLEAYNDYRRTKGEGVELKNSFNKGIGFPNFFPYPTSEASSNNNNMPTRDLYIAKPIWAK
ncbi:MAG: SusD/RagB family nutrient-binding outer membrane lipoprotein [Chitinophagaceae bacterium]